MKKSEGEKNKYILFKLIFLFRLFRTFDFIHESTMASLP